MRGDKSKGIGAFSGSGSDNKSGELTDWMLVTRGEKKVEWFSKLCLVNKSKLLLCSSRFSYRLIKIGSPRLTILSSFNALNRFDYGVLSVLLKFLDFLFARRPLIQFFPSAD